MSVATTCCPRCDEPLESSSLDGLCPRCVAQDFFGDDPEPPAPVRGVRMGDYEIFEEIARGGMGVVYRARQVSLDRVVAVKMVLGGTAGGGEAIARFKTEAAAAAGLRHPNIVAIYETGEEDGMHFFSMEFIEGQPLSTRMREGPLPAREAAAMLEKIARAAAYAHEHGVVHRDLKPSNVLLDSAGEPRVTDFGLAKRLGSGDDLTLSGQVLGSPGYLAPEQARGQGNKAGPLVDVYGIGAILYHALTGRAPFVGEDAVAILRQVERDDPPSLRLLNPGVPPELEAVALKCVAREPERRYESAQEVADELRRWLDGKPVLAKPMSRLAKGARWVRRNPVVAGASLAVFVALAAVAIISTISARRLEKSRNEETVQRERAVKARLAAEESAEKMRASLYAADMPQVQRWLSEGDLHKARLLLNAHRPAPGQRDLRGWEWRRLWRESLGDELASCFSGRDGLTGLAFSPDGSHVAMCSGAVTVWDTATLTLQKSSPPGSLSSLAFSPDGSVIFYGDAYGVVHHWLWRGDEPPAKLFRVPQGFARVAVSPSGDVLAVGTGTRQPGTPDGVTSLHDAKTGALLRTLAESGGMVEFSRDGALLATGAHKGAVKLWDPRTGELRRTFTGLPLVTVMRFSTDGRWLVVSRSTGTCRILNVETGEARDATPGYTPSVWGAALSPDGTKLATGSLDQSVRLWDAATGRELAKFTGHLRGAGQVAWSADGSRLATGGADGTVKFWPASPRSREPERLAGTLAQRAFSPDGRHLLVIQPDGKTALHAWPSLELLGSAEIGWPLGFLPGNGAVLGSVEVAGPPWRRVAREWSVPDLKPGRATTLPGAENEYHQMSLSDDGRWITGVATPGRVRVWDLANEGRPVTLAGPVGTPVASAFVITEPPMLAAGCEITPHLRLFSLPDGTALGPLPVRGGAPSPMLAADGGRSLIAGSGSTVVRKVNVAERREEWSFVEKNGPMALSPDGTTLACGTGGATVRLWHLPTLREVAYFSAGRRIARLAFSPDGSALLLSEANGETQILRASDLATADAPVAK